jgi:hypothetical protein
MGSAKRKYSNYKKCSFVILDVCEQTCWNEHVILQYSVEPDIQELLVYAEDIFNFIVKTYM